MASFHCRSLAAGAAIVWALANAPAAFAQAATYSFNLPAQDLGRSLRAVARRTGSNIVFEPSSVRGRTAPALSGSYSAEQAIERLLAGSGLVARRTRGGSWVVAQAEPPSGEAPAGDAMAVELGAGEEEIFVTGTNISGLANRTVPTTVLDREYIEATGYGTTVALIESLPQNYALASEGSRLVLGISDASTQGSTINLRGLGEGTTLTLLNGRRMALGYLGSAVDISGIPLSAVERVEILTDGASAIYGSDAIGGVVNFILRSDYEGAETSLRAGWAPGGINEYRASHVAGGRWGSGGITASVEYYHRDLLRAGARDFVPATSQVGSLLPEVDLWSLMLSARQDIGADVSVFADALYSQRDTFSSTFQLRNESYRLDNAQLSATTGIDWRISGDWSLELTGGYGRNDLFRTSRSILNGANGNLINEVEAEIETVEAKLDGTLLALPGGDVRAAIGGAFRWESLSSRPRFSNGTGNAGNPIDISQRVRSLYAELYAPIVGPGNRMPGVERLEISLAARLDHYNRFGSSFDPRVGAMWEPLPGVRLRGSWGTSFAAPKLFENFAGTIRGFALVQPDPLGGFTPQFFLLGTAVEDLGPQESTSWTLGLDLQPRAVPGLRLQANYYDISFRNRIVAPGAPGVMLANPEIFGDLVIRNPTPQQIADAIAVAQSGGNPILALTDVNSVVAIIDARRRNLARTDTSGLDLLASYSVESGPNLFNLAVNASWILELENAVTAESPPFEAVGTIFNPAELRIRGSAGWRRGGFRADFHVNFTDDYTDNRVTTAPVPVESHTTFDGRLAFEFENRPGRHVLDGVTLSLSAINIFNARPPRVQVIRPDADVGYDPTNASPLGRLVALEIAKRW